MNQPAKADRAAWGSNNGAMVDHGAAGRLLLRAVDVGLWSVICVAPFALGGRHDFGRLVLVSLVAATSTAWFVRQALLPQATWTKTAVHGLLLGAVALLVAQRIPWPHTWLAVLSPRTGELLPLWTGSGGAEGLETWSMLSLAPHETTKSLAMLASYGLLFLTVIGRVENAGDVRRLLRMVAVASVLMATVGLLQYVTSDGRFLWFYDHPYRSTSGHLCGSFINRNHFASFLVLGVGPLFVWLWELSAARTGGGSRTTQPPATIDVAAKWLVAAALVVVICAVLRTLSRGGAVALLTAATVLVAICWARRLIDRRYVYGLAVLAIVVVGILSLDGYEQLAGRLQGLTQGSLEAMDQEGGRRRIWNANLAAIQAGWLTGSGAGSHSEIYRVYLPEHVTVEYTHAESGYLQVATENGVVGVALLLGGIGLCGNWFWACWRQLSSRTDVLAFAACAAGVAASIVHSAVDFVWYIPACMSVTIVLGGCLLRLSQLAGARGTQPGARVVLARARWIELAAGAVLVALWSVTTYVGPGIAAIHWDRYLRASVASREQAQSQMQELIARRRDATSPVVEPFIDVMLAELKEAVAWDPNFARAQLRLAATYIAQFERSQQRAANVMNLPQIQDAAQASRFASADELRSWLVRAFGQSASLLYQAQAAARRAVRLGPLQGEGYVLLGELCFLSGGDRARRDAFFGQALRVRPHDADLLYEIGEQKFLSGSWDEALNLWRDCFADSGPHQWKIIYLQAARIPADMFVAIYRPNWRTLPGIWARYRALGERQDLEQLVAYAAEAAGREAPSARTGRRAAIWSGLAAMYTDLGRGPQALACLERAYAANSANFDVRLALANNLLAAGRYAEAESHVRWCLARRPEQSNLTAALTTIAKHRQAAHETSSRRVQRASFIEQPPTEPARR